MNVDFALLMVLATLISGGIWAFDAWVRAPRRKRAVAVATAGGGTEEAEARVREPRLVEYARSFFPIFLIVLLLRSFLVEPFRIPSGSMMPTLLIGDFILVNKYDYGIRLPVANTKVLELGSPQRGDIVVFRFPKDPSIPFIKRVVGVPGDEIAYYDRTLYINGKQMSQQPAGIYNDTGAGKVMSGSEVRLENLGGVEHEILINPQVPSFEGRVVVPPGKYFVMGDNRDNSRDSRYWGFVPDENLIGKAFLIWMSWDWEKGGIGWNRIGRSVE